MQKRLHSILGLILTVLFAQGQTVESDPQTFKDMAAVTLDSIYVHYGVPDESLLRETYPFDASHKATYLAEESQGDQRPNQYSYLWPFSGSLSAQVARYEMENAPDILEQIEQRVLPGLNAYYDKRVPHGYASYIQSAPQSDRFYDDNVWLGIDFTDLYIQSGNQKYLTKAKEIWEFVASGIDAKLGGGIYWYEQQKTSKNTCSNAPGVVFLVKLHQATNETDYLTQAIALYEWTKTHLRDPEDGLYWDNIKLDGQVDERKYPYNSGQMLQAATLLYQVTGEDKYLEEAQEIAESGHNFFFYPPGEHHSGDFRLLKNSDLWFIAVMLRGYVELYNQDGNAAYLNTFRDNLQYAWHKLRDTDGLFHKDWKNHRRPAKKWLLDQCAMVEMYARIAVL